MKFSSYKSVKVQQYLSMNEQTRFPPNPGLLVVAYGSLSRMITKKDQGGAVGFDSHYRSRPFRIPYKSNLCQRYIHRVLQTIQMKLILLWVWAERAVLGRAKTALKFKYEI